MKEASRAEYWKKRYRKQRAARLAERRGRVCPVCKKPIAATAHGRKVYCGPQCASAAEYQARGARIRARAKRYAAEHKAAIAARMKEYMRAYRANKSAKSGKMDKKAKS